jgi:hypothetical protein
MRPDEIEPLVLRQRLVAFGVSRVEPVADVFGQARGLQFAADIGARAAAGHRVEHGFRLKIPQQIADDIAATIAGITAVTIFTGFPCR